MNKKKLLLAFLTLLLAIYYFWQKGFGENIPQSKPEPSIREQITTPSPTSPFSQDLPTITYDEKKYVYDLTKVDDISKISLIENKEKEGSGELIKRYNCLQAINGGFYDTNGKPLGLLITNGQTINKAIPSSLLDGFIYIDNQKKVGIARHLAETELKIALQSGPMLIENQKTLLLQIKNDKYARRMAAAITKEKTLIFLTIFDPESNLHGPKLGDLPLILKLIAQKENLKLTSALNLDGGAASAFKADNISLLEYNPVGSLFCIK